MTDRTSDKIRNSGLLALSPLAVFLGIYLVSSIIAKDFYKIPTAAAFLIASAYALMISKKAPIEDRIAIFSQGAGHKNVLLMLWIFILAGAFAEMIKMDEDGKAYIKYPKDCWGCTSCLKECKSGAIAFFLGADIGGMGSEMTVNESKDTILWKIKKYTGEEETIEINKKDSNKY